MYHRQHPLAVCTAAAAIALGGEALAGTVYTLECPTISSGGAVISAPASFGDGSILIVGQRVVGSVSNASYTLEAGVVPCFVAGTTVTIPGDLDGDGDVDLADLAQLLANYPTASGATPDDGDIDGDGDVDLSDLAALLANYNSGG